MSKAEELFGNDILFVPDKNKKTNNYGEWKRPLAKGEYFGHIINVELKDVSFKGFKATVYNFSVQVAEESKSINFTFNDEEYTGEDYVGRIIKGLGVFKFLSPMKDDDFEANPSGNDKYLMFCKSIGSEIKNEEREIDGEKVKVDIMPNLSEEDVVGKPVVAVVDRGRPYTNKQGKEIKPWLVKFVKRWDEGEIKNFAEEIPF